MTSEKYPPTRRRLGGTETCARPPMGWECTREPGHKGPCAAIQTVDTKAKLITCEAYTEWKPVFYMSKEQTEACNKWQEEHDKTKHMNSEGAKHSGVRYSGAIGGAYTWSFTPTSLGTVVTIKCSCGEKIDVTDYDDW